MASEHFLQERAFLMYILKNTNKKQTDAVLDKINLKQSKLVSEIFLNFLKGNCSNTDAIVSKNKRFKDVIRDIGSPEQPLNNRRQLIKLHKAKVSSVLQDLSDDIETILEHEKICSSGGGEIHEVDIDSDSARSESGGSDTDSGYESGGTESGSESEKEKSESEKEGESDTELSSSRDSVDGETSETVTKKSRTTK